MLLLYVLAYNTGVSFFSISSKFVQTFVPSDTEVQFGSGLHSSQHRSLHRAFRSLLTDETKCLNELGRYVEKKRRNI